MKPKLPTLHGLVTRFPGGGEGKDPEKGPSPPHKSLLQEGVTYIHVNGKRIRVVEATQEELIDWVKEVCPSLAPGTDIGNAIFSQKIKTHEKERLFNFVVRTLNSLALNPPH